MTGAQVLATAGILSGVISSTGAVLNDARVVGAGAAVMLVGNIIALLVERTR